jgi:opacity protein-like surface antigen
MRMISKNLLAGCATYLALSGAPALAQEDVWSYDVSFNLWFNATKVTTDTPRGEVSSELSFSDAIQDLDFAFMGTAEARNGPWSIIGDLLYFKISASGATPQKMLFSEADVTSKTTVLTGVLAYRVSESDTVAFDVGAGFRAFWADLDTTLVGAAAPTETFAQSKDWIDPIIAARLRMAFNEKWFGTVALDAGGTGDSNTWQAIATVGYRINDRWMVQGGYRYMEAEWDTDLGSSSLEFSGPILGVGYRF